MNTCHQSKLTFESDPSAALSPYTSRRWSNAHVFKTQDELGREWVVKDFSPCNPFIRYTIAHFLLWREMRALRHLRNLDGIPGPIKPWGKWALAYPYIPGVTLREATRRKEQIGEHYFKALEDLVTRMHEDGIAHLDLRNKSNILVTSDGSPALIDFQTAVFTRGLPPRLRGLLFAVDFSGVYKCWDRFSPETLTTERREAARHMASLRRFWVLRGYPLRKYFRRRASRKRTPGRRDERT